MTSLSDALNDIVSSDRDYPTRSAVEEVTRFLASGPTGSLIAVEWRDDGTPFYVVDPATGRVLGQIHEADAEQVDEGQGCLGGAARMSAHGRIGDCPHNRRETPTCHAGS